MSDEVKDIAAEASDSVQTSSADPVKQDAPASQPHHLRVFALKALVALNLVLVLLVLGAVLKWIPRPSLQASTTPLVQPSEPSLPERSRGLPLPQKPEAPASRPAMPVASKGAEPVKEAEPVKKVENIPATWEKADRWFAAARYAESARMYEELERAARKNPAGGFVADYFLLRKGQSLVRQGKGDWGREELQKATESESPVVRAIACYELAKLDLAEEKFLASRAQTYRSIAAMCALDRPLALEADCAFLIARSLTETVRSFETTQRFIRWPDDQAGDPFDGLDKVQMQELLREGAGYLKRTSVEPVLTLQPLPDAGGRWRVTAMAVTVEDLLNQFGSRSKKDVKWIDVSGQVLNRTATFYLRSVSSQMLSEIAAGTVGLIGRFTLDDIRVYDPSGTPSSARKKDLLVREAISAWRLFFLRQTTDPRNPEARFALAAVYEWAGETVDAINEYELLARRYQRSEMAPKALLRSAKLKIGIMNYARAKQDMIDLLDLYPDYPGADEVYLLLAQVDETAGQWDEASRSYENLYYRNLSRASRRNASFGAGRCHYHQKNYKQATKWLARYEALISEPNPRGYADAYFLMARSQMALGDYDMAVQAFQRGFLGRPPAETRIGAMLDLADVHIHRKDCLSALGVLNTLASERLSEAQSCRRSILTAEIFRRIGLLEKARSELKLQLSTTQTPALRATVGVELARCHIAAEDYHAAQKVLTEILPVLPEGRSLWEASVLLAEVCLKLNEPDQAIYVAEKVRRTSCPDDIRRWAGTVLGEGYLMKKEYEKAALAFSDLGRQIPGAKTGEQGK